MKKWMMFALCAAMMLTLAACGAARTPDAGEVEALQPAGNVEIPSPFVDCDDLEEAEELAGFALELPDGPEDMRVTTIENQMIQVSWDEEDREITVRKAPGEEDISGDYNVYAEVSDVDVSGVQVTLRGGKSCGRS